MSISLLPEVEPLGFLLGEWRGTGIGESPTVDSFHYEEELEFANVGKPYLTCLQRTWVLRGDDRIPSHMEFAFWRPQPSGAVEVISAHPNGVAQIEVGSVEGTRVVLRSHRLVTSPSAKDVVRLERDFIVDGDALTYEVHMEAVAQPSWPAPSGGASPVVRVGESLTQSMSLDDWVHAPRS